MNNNENNKEINISEAEEFKKTLDEEFKIINFKLEKIPYNDQQINIKSINTNNPEKKQLIKIIEGNEENIINYYNNYIISKNFNINELKEKIIKSLDIVITNFKKINNYKIRNININPQIDYKPIEYLYNKYEKIYKNSVWQLICFFF